MIVSRWLLLAPSSRARRGALIVRAAARPARREHRREAGHVAEPQLDVPRTARAAAGTSSGPARQLASALTPRAEERMEGDTRATAAIRYHGDGVPTDRARGRSGEARARPPASLTTPAARVRRAGRRDDLGRRRARGPAGATRPRPRAFPDRPSAGGRRRSSTSARCTRARARRARALARDWYARAARTARPRRSEAQRALRRGRRARAPPRRARRAPGRRRLVVGWPAMTRPPLVAIVATAHDDGDTAMAAARTAEREQRRRRQQRRRRRRRRRRLGFRSAMRTSRPDEGDVQRRATRGVRGDLPFIASVGAPICTVFDAHHGFSPGRCRPRGRP